MNLNASDLANLLYAAKAGMAQLSQSINPQDAQKLWQSISNVEQLIVALQDMANNQELQQMGGETTEVTQSDTLSMDDEVTLPGGMKCSKEYAQIAEERGKRFNKQFQELEESKMRERALKELKGD